VNTPANEIMLNARSGSETAASAIVHRFQDTSEMTSAAVSQAAATHLDVTQSQLTAGDELEMEQPHGLEAIT